jgi:imidazolonepropionase-like amidohydrolase
MHLELGGLMKRLRVAVLFAGCLSPSLASGQSTSLVFYNVDVFDGYHMLRGQTVEVKNGLIWEVKPADRAPETAGFIDGSGKTLLPGLIDAHCHIGQQEEGLEQAAVLGVTTELDMWGDPKKLGALRREIERGQHPNAADFRTAGIGASVPGGHPSEMEGPPYPMLGPKDDAQAFVDARIAEGSDYLKIIYDHLRPGLTFNQLRELVVAAHRRNFRAVVHETVQKDGIEALRAGADDVEHLFADTPVSPDFINAAVENHTAITPTLAILSSASGEMRGAQLADDPRFSPYLLGWNVRVLHSKFPEEFVRRTHFEYACAATKALHQAGVFLLAGTDSPGPGNGYGLSMHVELQLLTECGLTPEEALRAATSAPAREFDLLDRGRIQAGRRADLLLVRGDPSKDVRATRDIVGVWVAGRKIDRDAVARMAEASRKQLPSN